LVAAFIKCHPDIFSISTNALTIWVLARRIAKYTLIWLFGYLKWRARLACRIARLTSLRSKFWAEITNIWGILLESIGTCSQTSIFKENLLRSYTGETAYICSSRTSTAGAIALIAKWAWLKISIWTSSNACFVEE